MKMIDLGLRKNCHSIIVLKILFYVGLVRKILIAGYILSPNLSTL